MIITDGCWKLNPGPLQERLLLLITKTAVFQSQGNGIFVTVLDPLSDSLEMNERLLPRMLRLKQVLHRLEHVLDIRVAFQLG